MRKSEARGAILNGSDASSSVYQVNINCFSFQDSSSAKTFKISFFWGFSWAKPKADSDLFKIWSKEICLFVDCSAVVSSYRTKPGDSSLFSKWQAKQAMEQNYHWKHRPSDLSWDCSENRAQISADWQDRYEASTSDNGSSRRLLHRHCNLLGAEYPRVCWRVDHKAGWRRHQTATTTVIFLCNQKYLTLPCKLHLNKSEFFCALQ